MRLTLVALLVSGCFGHSVRRLSPGTVVENNACVRYFYRSTVLEAAPGRGPATPVLAVPPADAREIGLIEVTVDYGGLCGEGLRGLDASFFPALASIAGEMGGTHFHRARDA